MRKMLLSGCNGRMGTAVSQICAERKDIEITAGLDMNTEKRFNYPVCAALSEFKGQADVIVDFSSPGQLEGLLSFCIDKQLPLVLCTTGYSEEQRKAIDTACAKIPVFRSGNMSLGIQLLAGLARKTAEILGEDFDVEIIEKHHRYKLDAPSGTAYMLYDALKETLPYDPEPVFDRHELQEKRKPHEIGMHALRGGTIVGEHEIVFAGRNEVITLSHSADSREVFAAGAVRAALFLAGQKSPGLYSMADIV